MFGLVAGEAKYGTLGFVAGSTAGMSINMTSGNTKGTWGELVASLQADVIALVVLIRRPAGGSFRSLIDIGIGGAGSEQVVIPDIFNANSSSSQVNQYLFPINLPAGTRLAARGQSASTTTPPSVVVYPIYRSRHGDSGLTKFSTYGALTASSNGTSVVSGASNTYGSWVELSSSVNAMKSMNVIAVNATAGGFGALQLGLGAASSEVPILEMPVSADQASRCVSGALPIPVSIPAGERLAARFNANTASDQALVTVTGGS